MNNDTRTMLQRTVERTLAAYLAQVEKQYAGVAVGHHQLTTAMQAFLASTSLNGLLDGSYSQLMEMAADELLRHERADPFHRLMVHPLTEAFDADRLSRDILTNYFSFIHLVLGDAEADLTTRCAEVCADLRQAKYFSWDEFYADLRAKCILWAVLGRIAESFRRFDARREWFISLMQNRFQAVSLAPNAFLPKPHSDQPHPFGAEQFNILFGDLFGPLRNLSPKETAAFRREFNAAPDQVFGPLFAHLTAQGAFT
jgi:hypothetical protein